ncbi:FixH family protein [Photobacterium japonica]|uniref:FixH family protein n=1 Tax=Photobacterium japonica TaxID=2910235 RepID=UPI003D0E2FC0
MPIPLLFATLMLLCLPLSLSAASPFPLMQTTPHFMVTAQPLKRPISLNRIHAWQVHITDNVGKNVEGLHFRVQGGMPAHRHGFPTQPTLIEETAPGEYLIDGMAFNMFGQWQLELINQNLNPPFHITFDFAITHENSQ